MNHRPSKPVATKGFERACLRHRPDAQPTDAISAGLLNPSHMKSTQPAGRWQTQPIRVAWQAPWQPLGYVTAYVLPPHPEKNPNPPHACRYQDSRQNLLWMKLSHGSEANVLSTWRRGEWRICSNAPEHHKIINRMIISDGLAHVSRHSDEGNTAEMEKDSFHRNLMVSLLPRRSLWVTSSYWKPTTDETQTRHDEHSSRVLRIQCCTIF